MTNQKKRPGMALWLKITIAVLVLGALSTIGLIVVGGMFLVDATKKTMDSKYTANVQDSIVKMSSPLPAGFTRIIAVDVMSVTEVVFANLKSGLQITLLRLKSSPKGQTADFIVDNYAKSGAPDKDGKPIAGGIASFLPAAVIEARGKMTVGGEEMPYAVSMRNINGVKVHQLVGCVIPKKSDRPILLMGQSSRGGEYPMELTKQFLSAIKSF